MQMRKQFLSILTVLALALSLVPTSAWASGGETAESGDVLTGAQWNEGGSLTPITDSEVTYTITENGSGGYTLTFSGSGAIPDYYTENQGYTADGTAIYKTNGAWQDASENTEGYSDGPANTSGTYRWCTSDRAYYRSTQWDVFNTNNKGAITKVVFEAGITGIGQFTLFNMEGVTSIEIQNPDCDISNNAVYYNGVDSPDCEIIVDSKAYNDKAVGYYNKGTHTIGHVSYTITDAQEFVDTYSYLLSLDTDNFSEVDRASIEAAYQTYTKGNEIFRSAVDNASVTVNETPTTFGEAFDAIYKAATGTDPDTIALKGYVQNSTVQYELTTEDGGSTYTLRFFAESGNGEMPDFAIKDTDPDEHDDIDRYQNAPWYDDDYRLKITHVIYDKSVKRTGYLSAAHLYYCTQFDFLNPYVEIASATIHYNAPIQANSVTLRYSGNVENASKIVAFNNQKDQEKVSVSYLEIEEFLGKYGTLFTQETIEKGTAEELKAGFEALPTACKVQLGIDEIPGTDTTYRDKLDALLAAAGSGPVDDSEVVNSGVIPSEDGANETIHYEIITTDSVTYTLRFYDEGGDGVMPDYEVTNSGTEDRDAWFAYENLPWVNGKGNFVKVIFENSITHVGSLVLANMSDCVEYEFRNPDLTSAGNAIFVNNTTNINENGITIRAYSTADVNWGYNTGNFNGQDGHETVDYITNRIRYSYYEAEQFEANTQYSTLWTLNTSEAEANSTLIQQAYRDYNKFANVVKTQLGTDVIPNTDITYAGQLESLMQALDLGGNVGEGVIYTLSLNDEDQHILTLSGTGVVSVTSTAPWNSHIGTIAEVVLEDGITGVDAGAFANLDALKSVDVAESVKTIDNGAFPTTSFEMHGWLNHASGRYADKNTNVQLKLKDLRILAIGNSHTGDYTNFADEILADLAPAVETEVTLEVLSPMGGRGLVIEQGDRGSHLKAAQDKNDKTYKYYQNAFEKTWDLIIVQDYHESTARGQEYGGDGFAEKVMKPALEWLRDAAKGAKIAWFADWADGSRDDLDETYQQSVAAMEAVSVMEDGPDFIIPASTVLQNARTSFLGTTHNAEGTFAGYTGQFTIDFEPNSLPTYTLLERDSTHMSYEVGRQLMASAFLYRVFQNYADELITDAGFDFFNQLETEPVYENTQYNVVWRGEFVPEIWAIIEEACTDAWNAPHQVTTCSKQYQTDPFAAKYDQVKNILGDVVVDETALSKEYLEEVFQAGAVVEALAAIPGLGIEKADITVTYTPPVDGTEGNPMGTSGSYTVGVDCHYGYTFPDGPALQKTILAKPYGDDGEHLQELKEEAIAKVNGFMSNASYSGSYRTAVEKAKADAAKAIAQAENDAAIKAAVQKAETTIDSQTTIFELEYQTDVDCVARGQIWTGGWAYGKDGTINKDTYVMDVGTDKGVVQNSEFTGVWWLVRQDGSGGYVIEFYPDPAIKTDEKAYTFETPVFNASHWLDPMTQEDHSQNPLQYNQTPWFKGYRNTLTKAVVHSGVTINQHTLACYPNITEYIIEDGANLGTNAIYFNPLQNDTEIRFEGSSTVEKDAVSGYRVANSYEYYIDVYGDMGKVTISSRDDMDREPLQGNLYYAFGKYDNTAKAWIASAQAYETIAVGLAGEGENISTGAGFAPHYTDGVDDGTTMLRVFNNTEDHSHDENSGNRILLPATAGQYPCQTGLSEGYVCKVCDAVIVPQKVILGREEHTWVAEVTKQPTTTERGEITYTCQGCGVTKIEYIARLQDEVPVVAAINGVNYNSLQYAIDRAQPGDTVVLLDEVNADIHLDAEDDVLLDLNGHTLTSDIAVSGQLTIQTSGDGGVVTGTISVENDGTVQTLSGTYSQNVTSFCPDGYGVILNGDNTYTVHQHIWDAGTVTKPATETADGVRTYKCIVEGCTAQKTERIPATGTEEPDDDDRPSSGGGSSDPSYSPILDVSDGGSIKVNPRTPEAGDEVTITPDPDAGYEVGSVTVTDRNGREIDVTAERDGTYTFEQPRGRVTIEATFVRTGETAGLPFVDVPASAYYYDAVAWAVENGVTGGTTATTFSPNNACTRAQMVTFLWRAAGEPEPETTVNPFTDVSENAYYYEAVLWAVEQGITNGTTETTFSPDRTVTRGQTVTFLWRNAGSPAASGSSFTDVAADAYYADAVAWAASEGITSGTTATTFAPNSSCTRAQIVTFLYRAR